MISDATLTKIVIGCVDNYLRNVVHGLTRSSIGLYRDSYEFEVDGRSRHVSLEIAHKITGAFPTFVSDLYAKHFSMVEDDTRLRERLNVVIVDYAKKNLAYELVGHANEIVRRLAKQDAERDFAEKVKPALEALYGMDASQREAELSRISHEFLESNRIDARRDKDRPRDWYDQG